MRHKALSLIPMDDGLPAANFYGSAASTSSNPVFSTSDGPPATNGDVPMSDASDLNPKTTKRYIPLRMTRDVIKVLLDCA